MEVRTAVMVLNFFLKPEAGRRKPNQDAQSLCLRLVQTQGGGFSVLRGLWWLLPQQQSAGIVMLSAAKHLYKLLNLFTHSSAQCSSVPSVVEGFPNTTRKLPCTT